MVGGGKWSDSCRAHFVYPAWRGAEVEPAAEGRGNPQFGSATRRGHFALSGLSFIKILFCACRERREPAESRRESSPTHCATSGHHSRHPLVGFACTFALTEGLLFRKSLTCWCFFFVFVRFVVKVMGWEQQEKDKQHPKDKTSISLSLEERI